MTAHSFHHAAPPEADLISYDAIIIGTGQAGPALARRLARTGKQVAIIERHRFGDTCINTGCTRARTRTSPLDRLAPPAHKPPTSRS